MGEHTAVSADGQAITLEDAFGALRAEMDLAAAEEDWEQLQELDRQARALVEHAFGEHGMPLRDETGATLREALQELADFYDSTVKDLTERRADAARRLRELREGRRGATAYEKTQRNSMGFGSSKTED
ncbi:flagellar protein FliT [Thioalkalivibrio sp. ALM2T]|uniref:flagellar protein FliT n=1 Tax=Thioalkalivibrio sp. ALM2T TaxID=1158184 RepID=UPI000371BE13|nr:flagellar protein FliT [Thioalkalivibrio sp. ALM2T]